jgi:hypothetical protein
MSVDFILLQAVYAAASSLASEKFISDVILDSAHKLPVHQEGLKFVKFASILLLEISREERAIKTPRHRTHVLLSAFDHYSADVAAGVTPSIALPRATGRQTDNHLKR